MIVAPARDPDFAENPVHGVVGQREIMAVALGYCRRRRTAVDAGAHIGLWTRELARVFSQVWAFEPCDENFRCLVQNVEAHLRQVALGDAAGSCGMEMPAKGNSGCWRVALGDTVPVQTLDWYGLEDVDFIKLDVEGCEGLVLRGAVNTLERCQPIVVFENNGLGLRYYGDAWVDPSAVLAAIGYEQLERLQRDEIWGPREIR